MYIETLRGLSCMDDFTTYAREWYALLLLS